MECEVTDLALATEDGGFAVTAIQCLRQGQPDAIAAAPDDLVFVQNVSMTDTSSLGSMTSAPAQLTRPDCTS